MIYGLKSEFKGESNRFETKSYQRVLMYILMLAFEQTHGGVIDVKKFSMLSLVLQVFAGECCPACPVQPIFIYSRWHHLI